MNIVTSDVVVQVPAGTTPNYNSRNPSYSVMRLVEAARLAAEREYYLNDSLQYLFPFSHLELYGPSGSDSEILDPRFQDNKTDFQKQNIKSFITTGTYLIRGWATLDNWTGPFFKISYEAGPDTFLAQAIGKSPGANIKVWLKLGNSVTPRPLVVPYNPDTARYELEIWSYPGTDLFNQLDKQGQNSMARGELITDSNLIRGTIEDFKREGLDNIPIPTRATDNLMHPVLPLRIEVAWTDNSETFWDSRHGANYHYEFNMFLRGWDNFLKVGVSANPHGGAGFLHYRNLFSNYGDFANSNELSRDLEPWNFDVFNRKQHYQNYEPPFAVNYMDLHVLKPGCAIGVHRHRDNQEVFLMMSGKGVMVTGDWNQFGDRERAFEVRTMNAGTLSFLKSGQLHSLINATDEDISLFMFGGYD